MDTVQNYRRQYVAAFCATLTTAASGTFIGWPSPSLPQLLEQGVISVSDGSWIASINHLSSTLAVLPAAYMADRLGRKFTIIMGSLPFVIGWCLIIFSSNITEIYVSRVFGGFGHGIVYTVCPMYLGEIASDRNRGALASMITLMSKFGILLQYCVGPYTSVKILALVNLLIPVLFICSFPFQPETPYFHVKQGNSHLAERSLKKLLGCDQVDDQLVQTEDLFKEQMKASGKWTDLIKVKRNRDSLIMLLVIYFIQQFCGSSAVINYGQLIFAENGGTIKPSDAAIIVGAVQLSSAIISVVLVDTLGRKPLLLISTLGVAITNTVQAIYLLAIRSSDIDGLSWLPVITVSMFIVSYTIGLATVPFAITSEVFPVNIKSYATCVIQMFVGLLTFAVVKLYQVIADNYGEHVIFSIFAAVSIFGFFYVIFKVHETRGKSLAQIYEERYR